MTLPYFFITSRDIFEWFGYLKLQFRRVSIMFRCPTLESGQLCGPGGERSAESDPLAHTHTHMDTR